MSLNGGAFSAHPRLRGEHSGDTATRSLRRGSSPLTRGAPGQTTTACAQERLIPAYAGSTQAGLRTGSPPRAHPRLRGEHGTCWTALTRFTGSSPLTRGAPPVEHRHGVRRGLIPAYAGSTSSRVAGRAECWAHPRLRGEHKDWLEWITREAGSSPLTRGALPRVRSGSWSTRLIPAYAGSTTSTAPVP